MLKTLAVTVVAAFVLLLTPTTATAVPGDAGHSRFVTKQEFRNIHKGMHMRRVHNILDIRGHQTWFYHEIDRRSCGNGQLFWCAEQSRDYRTKSRWGSVTLGFARTHHRGWVLTSKSAYWG